MQHNDKEWKFKEQHAKVWENIAGAKRYSRPRGFNIAGASAPVAPAVPTPLTVASKISKLIHYRIPMTVWYARTLKCQSTAYSRLLKSNDSTVGATVSLNIMTCRQPFAAQIVLQMTAVLKQGPITEQRTPCIQSYCSKIILHLL